MRTIFSAILLCVTLVFAKPPTDDSTQFYFVQITDTHWGDGNHLELTRKAIEMIKALPMKIEFIVHTGDLVARTVMDSNTLDSGLVILKSANIPLYFVAGNHDIDPKNPLTFKLFQSKVGPFFSQAKYHGVNVIFACSQPLADSFSIPDYSPVSELATALKKTAKEPCLLFVHSAPCQDFYKNSYHDSWPQSNLQKLRSIIDSSSIKAIIAGHFHRSDLYWIGDCPIYVCPSVAGYFGREASFRLYKYHNGKLDIISQYIPK